MLNLPMHSSTYKLKHFKFLLLFCLVDAFSPVYIILNYLTGIDYSRIINYVFVCIFILAFIGILFSKKLTKFSLVYIVLSIFELLKLSFSDVTIQNSEFRQVFSYFYGVIMPVVILTYTSGFSTNDRSYVMKELSKFCLWYFWIANLCLIAYSYFYFTGLITYFGMGVSYNYIFPFIVKQIGTKGVFYCLLFIFLSGKRAPLVTVCAQTLVYFSNQFKKGWLRTISLLIVIFTVFVYLWEYTVLLDRWKLMSQVNYQNLSNYDLLILGSGRIEEIIGYFEYVKSNPDSFFFGVNALENYSWIIDATGYVEEKNYLHVTFLTLSFRHGIFFATTIFFFLLHKLFLNHNTDITFKSLIVGVVVGSFFGANLITNPIAWILIGFYYNSSISSNPKSNRS